MYQPTVTGMPLPVFRQSRPMVSRIFVHSRFVGACVCHIGREATKVKFTATIGIAAGKHFPVGIEHAKAKGTPQPNRPSDRPTCRPSECEREKSFQFLCILLGYFGAWWDTEEQFNYSHEIVQKFQIQKYITYINTNTHFSSPYPIRTGTGWLQLCRLAFPPTVSPNFLHQRLSPLNLNSLMIASLEPSSRGLWMNRWCWQN